MENMKSIVQMARGAIEERIDLEMTRILENVLDTNTKATAKRKLTVVFEIQPDSERQTLNVSYLDLKSNKINIISSNELENMEKIIKSIIKMISEVKNTKIILIDLNKLASDFVDTVTGYCDKNFEINANGIINFIAKNIENKLETNLTFIIVGTEKFNTINNKNALNKVMEKVVALENANTLIIDSAYQLKKLSIESWYSNNIRVDQGLWIGSGIIDQNVIRITSSNKSIAEKINNNFGWKVKNGQGTLIKIMELDKNEK